MLRSLAAANSVPLSLPESAITRLSSTLPIWSVENAVCHRVDQLDHREQKNHA